ncbi:competence/damage-inducible protein A [Cytobacillus sp. Hz8]|uniref:competence/damage-inducible protein A n=1 Tax=Cytobacillus sp. Hz8 TaxID=3347168 RepID=UPI0035D6A67A
MNAEIIAVGSELLLGQIANTNAQFLSQELANMGIDVYFHTVVGDNSVRLQAAIEIAEDRADFIIFTGGLGPTKDDLTKETISHHLGKNLIMDEYALTSIAQFFQKTNRVMTDNNRKQALVLEDSSVLRNDHGMAPGMLFEGPSKMYLLLPGPPKELIPMFLTYGKPMLLDKLRTNEKIISRVLRFFGIGESMLETQIEDLIDQQSNPTIAPLAADGEVTLRLTAKAETLEKAKNVIDDTEAKILARVGEYFYGYDDTTLIKELFHLLKAKKWTIACAESLTGGLFQEELTSLPGASNHLKGGIICYTNEVKERILRVRKETLENEGAVSEPCAAQLAENVAHLLDTDIGISFTGVAGPGELEGKPAGTVFVGISMKNAPTIVKRLSLAGSREANRMRTVKYGCYYLINRIKEITESSI